MLPTINLALAGAPDTAVTEGETSSTLTLNGEKVGSFADLLRAPIPIAQGPHAGNPLPLTGELLPVDGDLESVSADGQTFRNLPQTEHDETALAADHLSVELWSADNRVSITNPAAEVSSSPIIVSPLPQGLRVPGESTPTPSSISRFSVEEMRDVWHSESSRNRATSLADGVTTYRAPTPLAESLTPAQFSAALADGVQDRSQLGSSANPQHSTLPALSGVFTTPAATAGTGQISPAPSIAPGPVPGIEVALGDAGWADALGQRVLLLTGQRQTSAEIRLTPAELGPIRVNISLDDGAANVTFAAQHAPAREAIESALPRLREMLGEHGVALGDANVSDHAERRDDADSRTGWAAEDPATETESREDSVDRRSAGRALAVGLIDTYV